MEIEVNLKTVALEILIGRNTSYHRAKKYAKLSGYL
jgi:hypothetical protein